MSIAKTMSAVQRSAQFQNLLNSGLTLVSTERQLSNGTLAFTGKIRSGRKTIRPTYSVTANGAVISNEFVARRVEGNTPAQTYRAGLAAIAELFSKRAAA